MRVGWLLLVGALLCGCSFVVDSDQYLRRPGTDGSVDSSTTVDGGADASDLCAEVTCGPGMVCDPLTGSCGAACEPACGEGEVCAAGSCMDCDADDDGSFVAGARCAALRGDARADCDDGRPEVFPGAPIVCADGVVNDCPESRLGALLALADVEVARLRPFRVEDATPSDVRRELGLVYTDDGERGWTSFVGDDGPALARWDFETRATGVVTLEELGVAPMLGFVFQGGYLGFAGRPLLALHSTRSATHVVSIFTFDVIAGTANHVDDYTLSTFFPPLTVGIDRSGAAAIGRTMAAGAPMSIYRMGVAGGSGVADAAIASEPDWLTAAGELVMGPSTIDGSVIVADFSRPPRALPVEAGVIGAGDVMLIETAGPRYLAAVPTVEGIVPVIISCSGGFPLNIDSCSFSLPPAVGPDAAPATAVARALDYNMIFAEADGAGGEAEVAVFPVDGDGEALGPELSFPVITSADTGFAPAVSSLEATHRFLGDSAVVVLAANLRSATTGTNELWITGLRMCAAR